MALDPKKRWTQEATFLDRLERMSTIRLAGLRELKLDQAVATSVFRDGDEFYCALMGKRGKRVLVTRLNAVAAVTMALAILRGAEALFPGELEMEDEALSPAH
jgi:hypothetical protein